MNATRQTKEAKLATFAVDDHDGEVESHSLTTNLVQENKRRQREEEGLSRELRRRKVEAKHKTKKETEEMEIRETQARYSIETKFTNDRKTAEKEAKAAEFARKKEEILDLLAYLISGGDKTNKMFN